MFGLAIHGGAGTLPRADMNPDRERLYRAGLAAALEGGFAVLKGGGTSLDAVTRAVMLLEDNPLFNAGHGAVFTLDGRNELDASIMDGTTRMAGAVCGVTHIKNPVELARAVMEHSEYVFLSGCGAEEFALTRGFELVPRSYVHTAERWRQLERIRDGDGGVSASTISHVGTVGAVALDDRGRLAAATSTGAGRARRRTRSSTSSPRISSRSSTRATSPSPRSGASSRATGPARPRWSSTGSACRRPLTTGRSPSTSSRTGWARSSTSRPRPARMNCRRPTGRWWTK
jgi:beta-aspartyl-peptidase (threonine type)